MAYKYIPCPRCAGRMDVRAKAQLCRQCFLETRPDDSVERFWAKVQKSDGCWNWIAAKHLFGYGNFKFHRQRRTINAHRASWIIHFANVPRGMCVLHKCDNPACVRPDHLFLGTHADNMADKCTKNRQARGTTHGSRTMPDKFPGSPQNFIGYRGRKVARRDHH